MKYLAVVFDGYNMFVNYNDRYRSGGVIVYLKERYIGDVHEVSCITADISK